MKWFKKKTKTEISENSNSNIDVFKGLELFERAKHYYNIKQDVEAIKYFKEAIEFGLDTADCLSSIAICYQSQKNHEEALNNFDKAIIKAPHDCNIYYMRSWSKSAVKDFDGALSDIQKAVELSKVDSSLNKTYNDGAKRQGFSSITSMYESFLSFALLNCENKDFLK